MFPLSTCSPFPFPHPIKLERLQALERRWQRTKGRIGLRGECVDDMLIKDFIPRTVRCYLFCVGALTLLVGAGSRLACLLGFPFACLGWIFIYIYVNERVGKGNTILQQKEGNTKGQYVWPRGASKCVWLLLFPFTCARQRTFKLFNRRHASRAKLRTTMGMTQGAFPAFVLSASESCIFISYIRGRLFNDFL